MLVASAVGLHSSFSDTNGLLKSLAIWSRPNNSYSRLVIKAGNCTAVIELRAQSGAGALMGMAISVSMGIGSINQA